jgi:hypothetical protein
MVTKAAWQPGELLWLVLGFLACCLWSAGTRAAESNEAVILLSREASAAERLAAREVRRYAYLRTGRLFPIVAETNPLPQKAEVLLVARKDRDLFEGIGNPEITAAVAFLRPQTYLLKTITGAGLRQAHPGEAAAAHRTLLLAGADDAGTLYAAYRFAEVLGVLFAWRRDPG